MSNTEHEPYRGTQDAALFRSLRLSAGLTQAQVGAELGMHVTMINRYEKGRAPIPKAVLIALECVVRHRPHPVAATDPLSDATPS